MGRDRRGEDKGTKAVEEDDENLLDSPGNEGERTSFTLRTYVS